MTTRMTPAETRNDEDQLPSPAVETQAREITLIPETQETPTSSHTETPTPVEEESAICDLPLFTPADHRWGDIDGEIFTCAL